jgi:hypothetical protein
MRRLEEVFEVLMTPFSTICVQVSCVQRTRTARRYSSTLLWKPVRSWLNMDGLKKEVQLIIMEEYTKPWKKMNYPFEVL